MAFKVVEVTKSNLGGHRMRGGGEVGVGPTMVKGGGAEVGIEVLETGLRLSGEYSPELRCRGSKGGSSIVFPVVPRILRSTTRVAEL